MEPTTTKITEQVALDGPVSVAVAVLLGLAILAVVAGLLWRERKVLGFRQAVLFWLLRSGAIATVLWMLLAPASERVEVTQTRKAIAVIHDATGSMRTVDPAGTANDLRWAVSSAGRSSWVAHADQAVVSMGLAHRHLESATAAISRHLPEKVIVEHLTGAEQAVETARTSLSKLADSEASTQLKSLARDTRQSLEDAEFQSLRSLARSLERGRTPAEPGWQESLPDLAYRVTRLIRSLQELARQTAAEEQNRIARSEPGLLLKIAKQSRSERTTNYVQQLQRSVLDSLGEKADLRFGTLDKGFEWSPLLAPLPPQDAPTSTNSASDMVSVGKGVGKGGTNLSAALQQLQRQSLEQPIAATFLFTDVAHNETHQGYPADIARSLRDCPVYIVPIGNTRYVRDVILQSASAPAVAMRNDDIVIEANLEAHDCAGETSVVELLQDGQVIDFREVTFDSDFVTRAVRFEHRVPAVGTESFQIAVQPLNGEATDENNYDEVEVNVTRSDIKILLADELPRWEYRYLTQLFRRDAKIECDELLFRPRVIATGRREETRSLPTSTDEWDQYDVVLLGDLPPAHFPIAAQESLVEYMHKRGGTVVLIAGRFAMPHAYADHPLQEILPVQPITSNALDQGQAFNFQVTESGASHEALMIAETESATRTAWDFINRYSPLREVSDWRKPLPSAETLIAAVPRNSLAEPNVNTGNAVPSSAFLCWQPVGRGRVVYLAGPETFRLRFLRGDRLHYRFWGQLLRWAIASDLAVGSRFVQIRTDKSRYRTGDEILVEVHLSDDADQPVVSEGLSVQVSSGNEAQTVELQPKPGIPGEYSAAIRSLAPGIYRLEPAGETIDRLQQESIEPAVTSITVQADLPQEMIDTRCDLVLAQQIAEATGGQVLPPTAVANVLSLTNLDPIVTEKIERKPLWLQWKYLWLIFACLQIEWIVRKWKGLS